MREEKPRLGWREAIKMLFLLTVSCGLCCGGMLPMMGDASDQPRTAADNAGLYGAMMFCWALAIISFTYGAKTLYEFNDQMREDQRERMREKD